MEGIIQEVRASELNREVKVMVGGAPVTQDFADSIGADGYAPDAGQAVRKAKELLKID
jgi:5-methyltetrahydrofolate--homocysteine methyltransferase